MSAEVGDPTRHVWCNMNSSHRLAAEPNVAALRGEGALDDRYLAWRTTKPIPAGTELLWPYDILLSDEPEGKKRAQSGLHTQQSEKRAKNNSSSSGKMERTKETKAGHF